MQEWSLTNQIAFLTLMTTILIGILSMFPTWYTAFFNSPSSPNAETLQPLSGTVWTKQGDALPGIIISLPEFSLSDTTNTLGTFSFKIKAVKDRQIKLIAQKRGYHTYDIDPIVGNTTLSFIMQRKK